MEEWAAWSTAAGAGQDVFAILVGPEEEKISEKSVMEPSGGGTFNGSPEKLSAPSYKRLLISSAPLLGLFALFISCGITLAVFHARHGISAAAQRPLLSTCTNEARLKSRAT